MLMNPLLNPKTFPVFLWCIPHQEANNAIAYIAWNQLDPQSDSLQPKYFKRNEKLSDLETSIMRFVVCAIKIKYIKLCLIHHIIFKHDVLYFLQWLDGEMIHLQMATGIVVLSYMLRCKCLRKVLDFDTRFEKTRLFLTLINQGRVFF